MITDFLKATKKLGIGLAVGSALAMGVSPAFAGGKARYYEKDFSNKTIKLAQWASGKVSNKLGGVTFLVYGGNEKQVNIARNVAKRLNAEGIPVGFIKALDLDKIPDTMRVSFYTMGGTKFYSIALNSDAEALKEIEHGLYEQAKEAYQDEFGEKVTKKR